MITAWGKWREWNAVQEASSDFSLPYCLIAKMPLHGTSYTLLWTTKKNTLPIKLSHAIYWKSYKAVYILESVKCKIWSNSYHKETFLFLWFLWLNATEFKNFEILSEMNLKKLFFLYFIGIQIFELYRYSESYSKILLTEQDCKMLQFWSCSPLTL